MSILAASDSPVSGTALLEARGLCKFYGEREVLHEVDFAIRPREIVTIVGPNGAGKTTLLKCLLGLESADFGAVTRGTDLRIGYVPQHFKPQPSLPLKVKDFLALYVDDAGSSSLGKSGAASAVSLSLRERLGEGILRAEPSVPSATLAQAAPSPNPLPQGEGFRAEASLVERLSVGHLLQQQMANLSGGELRRVLLLRALLKKPNLLVLDEPTAGVDVGGQGELYRLLKKLSEELGFAVLMVSHDLYVVMASTSRVICLNHHVCCEGTPQHVGGDASFRAMFGDQLADQIALYHHHHTHSHGLGDEEYPHVHHHPQEAHTHHHHHHFDDDDGPVTHVGCCHHDR